MNHNVPLTASNATAVAAPGLDRKGEMPGLAFIALQFKLKVQSELRLSKCCNARPDPVICDPVIWDLDLWDLDFVRIF